MVELEVTEVLVEMVEMAALVQTTLVARAEPVVQVARAVVWLALHYKPAD